MKYLMGIDLGTSACKVAIFSTNGKVIVSKSGSYPVYYPKQGYAEQNPDEWWKVLCGTIQTVLATSSVAAKDIVGIGVDGQSWSAVAVDKEGSVLTNTPIWMDTRADDICNNWQATLPEGLLFSCCGNPLKPSYTTPKIGWYQKYLPEVYAKTEKILQANSFIVYRLTDQFSHDLSQGYGLHCFDMENRCWDVSICKQLGFDVDLLPPLFACHDVVGQVTKKAASLTGLKEGTPVVAGGLDAACGALGAGVLQPGDTQEQGGQAGGMSICTDRPIADPNLILGCHVVPNRWLLQGGTVGGGGVMRWLEQEFGDFERSQQELKNRSSFAQLDLLANAVPAGSDGLVFLPYMAGERSPLWDKDAKGVFYGLDFSKTKGHFIRAGLEGVAFSLQHNLAVAQAAGCSVKVLRAMGGAANSKLWTQIKADVTGLPIEVPMSDTATTLGAAILAGVGVGVFSSFEEAVKKTVTVTRIHTPNPDTAKVYRKNYDCYLALYQSLKPLMHKKGEE